MLEMHTQLSGTNWSALKKIFEDFFQCHLCNTLCFHGCSLLRLINSGGFTFFAALRSSDGKYRYNKVSISIDTAGPVINKYQYFPFIFWSDVRILWLGSIGKCYHFFKKICRFLQENFTFFAGKYTIFLFKIGRFPWKNRKICYEWGRRVVQPTGDLAVP